MSSSHARGSGYILQSPDGIYISFRDRFHTQPNDHLPEKAPHEHTHSFEAPRKIRKGRCEHIGTCQIPWKGYPLIPNLPWYWWKRCLYPISQFASPFIAKITHMLDVRAFDQFSSPVAAAIEVLSSVSVVVLNIIHLTYIVPDSKLKMTHSSPRPTNLTVLGIPLSRSFSHTANNVPTFSSV